MERHGQAASPKRWIALGLGTFAQLTSCSFLYGLPFLIPEMRSRAHLSLAAAGWVVAAPSFGLVATLVLWGALADRHGERHVIAIGLTLAGALVCLAPLTTGTLSFGIDVGVAGAAAGSVNAASGRLVMGWFGPRERGLAMGVRQSAQPLGVALAALVLPPLAGSLGFSDALLAPGALCILAAALVGLLAADPPRPAGAGSSTVPQPASPYRSASLWRVHASSALLVVPQFAVSAFAEEYLVSLRHWSPDGAGRALALVGLAGAAGRLAVGHWSDRTGSRLRPMRLIAVASTAAMAGVGAATHAPTPVALGAIAAASIISVVDNGLGFTATAELAGTAWAGRALGVQNTGQNVAAFLTPALVGAIVDHSSYAVAFLACAAFPALGIATVPVKGEAEARARRTDGVTPSAPAAPGLTT
ncbi:MAG: major facilitator transporter [Acidimicrobiaceae bacterium]|nr:major facilitator transporter [Acidimicrobiaceae bacterium]